MNPKAGLAIVIMGSFFLQACSSDSSGNSVSIGGSGVRTTTDDYSKVECSEILPSELLDEEILGSPADKVECGFVQVPADWSSTEGEKISLAVYQIPSTSENPAADPVIYLEGGPGGAGVGVVSEFVSDTGEGGAGYLRSRSDVIVLDQRGTGYSRPALYCPEVSEAELSDEDVQAAYINCRDRFINDGVNLQDYNSANNARDVEAVRIALGYENWNLYGLSYGTRLALTAMRDNPAPLKSIVLDSVFPPEVNGLTETPYTYYFAIEQIARNCVADDDCTDNVGDIKALIENGIARLDANPIVSGDDSFEVEDYIQILGDEISNPELPTMISAVASASDAELIELLTEMLQEDGDEDDELPPYHLLPENLWPFAAEAAELMFAAVICQEEFPFPNDVASPQIAGNFSETTQRILNRLSVADDIDSVCGIIDVQPAGRIEVQPVTSSVPALILAGTSDLQTPPAWSRLSAASLPNSQYAEFAGLTHGLLGANSCVNNITREFLDNPGVDADQLCISVVPGVDYLFEE